MLESESLIIRGKLKGLTVLRAFSVRLIKSDAPAKLAGSNLEFPENRYENFMKFSQHLYRSYTLSVQQGCHHCHNYNNVTSNVWDTVINSTSLSKNEIE